MRSKPVQVQLHKGRPKSPLAVQIVSRYVTSKPVVADNFSTGLMFLFFSLTFGGSQRLTPFYSAEHATLHPRNGSRPRYLFSSPFVIVDNKRPCIRTFTLFGQYLLLSLPTSAPYLGKYLSLSLLGNKSLSLRPKPPSTRAYRPL